MPVITPDHGAPAEPLAAALVRLFAVDPARVVVAFEAAPPADVAALPVGPLLAVAKSYRQARRFDQAVALCHRAVKAAPGDPSAHANLITSLAAAGLSDQACDAADLALAQLPDAFAVLVPAAVAAQDAGLVDLAMVRFRRILDLRPDYAPAHLRLAMLYNFALQDFPAAEHHARSAADLAPGDPNLDRLLGEFLLRRRDYTEGFRRFSRRLDGPSFLAGPDNRNPELPFWTGGDLSGRLVIHTETAQGVGFELLCAGLLPHLRARGISYTCEASAKLVPMMQDLFPGDFVALDPLATGANVSGAVARANLTTLSAALWSDVIRRPLPPLPLAPRPGHRPRIGLSWHAGNATTGAARSIPLDDFAPLIRDLPGVTWVSLQAGDVAREIEGFCARTGCVIEGGHVDFVQDNAALIAAVRSVDLVISIVNSTVYYADALGKPVFVILPVAPYWIWGETGTRTPWVPTAQIVRRRRDRPAADCLREIGARLKPTFSPALGSFWWSGFFA